LFFFLTFDLLLDLIRLPADPDFDFGFLVFEFAVVFRASRVGVGLVSGVGGGGVDMGVVHFRMEFLNHQQR
jgi:hypothetical protein